MSRDYRDAAQLREAEVAALERIADALERIAADFPDPASLTSRIIAAGRERADG